MMKKIKFFIFHRIKQSKYLNKDLLIIKFKFFKILLKIKSSIRFLTEFKTRKNRVLYYKFRTRVLTLELTIESRLKSPSTV